MKYQRLLFFTFSFLLLYPLSAFSELKTADLKLTSADLQEPSAPSCPSPDLLPMLSQCKVFTAKYLEDTFGSTYKSAERTAHADELCGKMFGEIALAQGSPAARSKRVSGKSPTSVESTGTTQEGRFIKAADALAVKRLQDLAIRRCDECLRDPNRGRDKCGRYCF